MSGETSLDDALPPISADDPCGPDLDLEGDADFLNYMASSEGKLPASFFWFDPDKDASFPFDPKSIDFAATEATGFKLLARSHDVRLLVLFAKLAILRRDLAGFAHWIGVTARLLADHWDEANPRGEDGDFTARLAQLATLDDNPVVILPLQHVPLAETPREGPLAYRAQLILLGKATPIANERTLDAAAIDRVLSNSDLAKLGQTLATLQRLKAAIGQIKATTTEKVGYGQAPGFETLAPLVDDMTAFIQAAVALRDPTVAAPDAPAAGAGGAEEQGQAATPLTAAFNNLAEADAALASALGYFVKSEPSSPAVLLVGQARQLLGKNLYEVMKILAPTHADAARIFVGAEPGFTVPVSSVAANDGSGEALTTSEAEPAASRAAALSLIDAVAAYLRKVEPSSPAPLLLDQAKALAPRDFLGLLKELLPDETLALMRRNPAG